MLDPENPIVKLCSEGIMAEARDTAKAVSLFTQAWETHQDDFEACIAAHYLARHQPSPEETLRWNQLALDRAEAVSDDRALGFLPSLHLNLGASYEALSDFELARHHFREAERCLDALPEDPYGDLVRRGVQAGLARVS